MNKTKVVIGLVVLVLVIIGLGFYATKNKPKKVAVPQKATLTQDGKFVANDSGDWQLLDLSNANFAQVTSEAVPNGVAGQEMYVIRLQFDPKGQEMFAKITTDNIGRQMAIALDGQVISSPYIQNPITNGEAVISGNFTKEQADATAAQFSSGKVSLFLRDKDASSQNP